MKTSRKVIPLVFAAVILAVCVVIIANFKRDKSTVIYEIPDTEAFAAAVSTNYRYFVIANPPSDLNDLYELVKEYVLNAENDFAASHAEDTDIKQHWLFFRETRKINRDWKEYHSPMDTDRIEDHADDMIASAYWDGDNLETIRVFQRSSGWFDYGKIQKKLEFVL